MKNLGFIVGAVIFGGLTGFVIAWFDAAYSISETVSSKVGITTLFKLSFEKEELHALLFFGVQIFCGAVFGLLTMIGALASSDQKRIFLIGFILGSGLLRGGVNFVIAYNYQIAMFDPNDLRAISTGWRNVLILTIVHLFAGSLICFFSVELVRTFKN